MLVLLSLRRKQRRLEGSLYSGFGLRCKNWFSDDAKQKWWLPQKSGMQRLSIILMFFEEGEEDRKIKLNLNVKYKRRFFLSRDINKTYI